MKQRILDYFHSICCKIGMHKYHTLEHTYPNVVLITCLRCEKDYAVKVKDGRVVDVVHYSRTKFRKKKDETL